MRKFEVISAYEGKDINLPVRKTEQSAGYDFEAADDIVIQPGTYEPTLVPTGIKAQMEPDDTLLLFNRSSNPKKRHLVLPNSVGVIDADYYNNQDNEGHIMFMFYNISNEEVFIHKGDTIGQGVFVKFGTTVDDVPAGTREGGFGSTGN